MYIYIVQTGHGPPHHRPAFRIQALALASTSAGKKTTARYSTMVTPRPIHGSTLDILEKIGEGGRAHGTEL